MNRYCKDCGVAVPSYVGRCTPCFDLYLQTPKPLANNCGVCGQDGCASKHEVGGVAGLVVCRGCSVGNPSTREWCQHCGKGLRYYGIPQRPSWDDYFFEMAKLVSTRATCPRASVGVVLVDAQHRVIATGYNGAESGQPHCVDIGCEVFAGHCQRAVHAEESAVAWGADSLLDCEGVVAYVYGPQPVCTSCSRILRRAGVVDVKWRKS